jgi:hypothetical protein
VQTADRVVTETVVPSTIYLQWTPVIAGALAAAALSFILITFGSALGLSMASAAPTWRDASWTLAAVSGLFLLLTAIASFGLGGYVAGRLRERWTPRVHDDFVEFRDGTHGVLAWALAVLITACVAALASTAAGSKSAPAAAIPAASTGESLFPYDLDKLFRTERRPEGDPAYSRSEAARILLAATGRTEITAEDKAYLARLVANRTGVAQPDAERRVNEAIQNATIAVHKARRSAVVLAFSLAVSLLAGAATAWYGATLGGRRRDEETIP